MRSPSKAPKTWPPTLVATTNRRTRKQFDVVESPDLLSAAATASLKLACVGQRANFDHRALLGLLPKRLHLVDVEPLRASCRARPGVPRRSRSGWRNLALVLRSACSGSTFRKRAMFTSTNSMSPNSSSISSCEPFARAASSSASSSCSLSNTWSAFSQSKPDSRRLARRSAALPPARAARAERRRAAAWALARSLFLFRLDLVPAALHVVRRLGGSRPEDVRMAADQLLLMASSESSMSKQALLGGHLREEHGLQQKIAQFLGQPAPIARVDGVQHLVGLFERVRLDGVEGLFAVPRAAARRAQPRHDLDETLEPRTGCTRILSAFPW